MDIFLGRGEKMSLKALNCYGTTTITKLPKKMKKILKFFLYFIDGSSPFYRGYKEHIWASNGTPKNKGKKQDNKTIFGFICQLLMTLTVYYLDKIILQVTKDIVL